FVGNFNLNASSAITRLGAQGGGSITSDGQGVTVDITLTATGSIAGTVFHFGGSAASAGATIRLSNGQTTTAGSQGHYRLGFVPVATYNVDAPARATGDRGRSSASLATQDQVVTANITLIGTGKVVIAVQDGGGTAVSGAQVSLDSQTIFGGR